MKIISSEKRFECPIFWVTEDRAVEPDGFEIKRAIVQHRGSAVMMAVDDAGRILLVRQFRLPARASMWELPAGRLDEGEDPLAAAQRELVEETGYRAREWTELISFYPSPGYVSEKMTIFVASGLTEGEAEPMDDERIECRWFTSEELDRMIASKELQDGKTLIGYMAWKQYGRR